jgi:uncharacterized membrane protein YgcG
MEVGDKKKGRFTDINRKKKVNDQMSNRES